VAGWEWSRFGGDRSGGSGPVFGVVGWEWSRFGGGRVGVVPFWGWSGGSGPVFGVDLGTSGGGWTKIVLSGVLRVLSGVSSGFRNSGGGWDLS
jgi:hypothetical protein